LDIPNEMVGAVVVVAPRCEYLDAGNSGEFKRDVAAAMGNTPQVVLDLGQLQFIDSSGCGVMISLLRQLKAQGGDMKLCALTKTVRSVLELVRMHKIFDIFNTREEAVKAFQQDPSVS